ncbi:MAG: hypothetical protein COB04_05615 [Gammaproteobacteria bacterium]|nr:MAG: hypothetical protein COB04_05615 [Gammaproteobacteria bacterium]
MINSPIRFNRPIPLLGLRSRLLYCQRLYFKLTSSLLISSLLTSALLTSVLLISPPALAIDPPSLTLVRALQINYESKTQPSGLTFCRGKLLTVSDKHDSVIFEIKLKSKTAQLIPYIELNAIPNAPNNGLSTSVKARQALDEQVFGRKHDWEGISCDAENNLYLLSEAHVAVAKINAKNQLSWLSIDFHTPGSAESLFTVYNGYLEGITWTHDNRFVVAAERQERGLMSVHKKNSQWKVDQTTAIPSSTLEIAQQRSKDFAGIDFEKNWLFTLERNLFAICRRSLKDFSEQFCWSYKDSELDNQYRYLDAEFGTAEGIAHDKGYIYVILDNNEKLRASNHTDAPLLFIFKKPNNWLHPRL